MPVQKQQGVYHRPGYLRTLGAYEGAKKGYEFCRGFVGVRTIAPVVEWVAEGTLAKLPVIKHLKDEETADGYPVLHGIDNRLAEMLQHFDDYLDVSVANPKTIQGRAIRIMTHSVYAVAGWTPVVGGRIRRLMIEIDPDHMSRVPRLMDRPALDTADDGKNGYDYLAGGDRASFDRDMDDVSVMTDETSEEVSSEKQSKKKNKKEKRKDKRFLQNMGKGIKKVINYPKTPVHENAADVASGKESPSPSIGAEEAVHLSSSGQKSTAEDASATSSSSTGTPHRNTARKFFGSTSSKKDSSAAPVQNA